MRDYSLLRGKIREKLKNEYVLADKLKWSKSTVSNKLNGISEFTQDEIEAVCQILDIERVDIPAYFFTSKV